MNGLHRIVVRFTWIFALVFVPIETYWSFAERPVSVSGYAVNIVGVGVSLWGLIALRRKQPYGLGLLAAGWGWTTATFWRGTNWRHWLMSQGESLAFGRMELWGGPIITSILALVFVGSLVLLLNSAGRRA